jgi:choline kinase
MTGLNAIILAAGVGRRLGGGVHLPKALLSFAGRTLLERHLDILESCGVEAVTVVVGFRQELVREALRQIGGRLRLEAITNPDYASGSVVSLAAAAATLRSSGPVLLMDADVLYDRRLMARLVESPLSDCLLLDREIEPGDEPVKICVAGGRIVDFHKIPKNPHEWHGESVGFFRFSPQTATALADRAQAYVASGRSGSEYEDAIRDLILENPDRFGFEDVSGLPWTEIDFIEDLRRAQNAILPRLVA